jgi:Protein of unknown function (DUF1456)
MNNNDIFKKLRVALMLRDDQIIEILKLVDFRMSKSELSAFFRDEKHPNYMDCGDQVLRNFLNGMVIYYRGTKENPKVTTISRVKQAEVVLKNSNTVTETKKTIKPKSNSVRTQKKQVPIVEKVKFKNKKRK